MLRRLVDALAPGGTIFLGDFDGLIPPVPVSVPEPGDADLITRFVDANWRALELHGAYRGWAREAPQELQHCGLIDIASHQLSQRAGVGSAGHRLLRANVRMLRSSLLTWMTADELDRLDRILDDPQTVMFSHSLVFSWGRKEL
ncbi:hypothetical protein SAZ11_07070 [Streptomyces sp. FXJ1.4098]|nr:hypothetical protein [Streptomyces sp. FXJ1.4098]